jgi:hypothetical protein
VQLAACAALRWQLAACAALATVPSAAVLLAFGKPPHRARHWQGPADEFHPVPAQSRRGSCSLQHRARHQRVRGGTTAHRAGEADTRCRSCHPLLKLRRATTCRAASACFARCAWSAPAPTPRPQPPFARSRACAPPAVAATACLRGRSVCLPFVPVWWCLLASAPVHGGSSLPNIRNPNTNI